MTLESVDRSQEEFIRVDFQDRVRTVLEKVQRCNRAAKSGLPKINSAAPAAMFNSPLSASLQALQGEETASFKFVLVSEVRLGYWCRRIHLP